MVCRTAYIYPQLIGQSLLQMQVAKANPYENDQWTSGADLS